MKLSLLSHSWGLELKSLINQLYEKGFFHLLSADGLAKLFGFASQFIVAWLLIVDELGRIKIVQSYLALAVIIGGAGFNTSVLKLCSEDRDISDKKELLNTAILFSVIICLITYILLVILGHLGILTDKKEIIALIPWFGLALFPHVIIEIQSAFLQALHHYKKISFIQVVTKAISVLLILVLTYSWSLYGYVSAYIIGSFIALIAFMFNIKSILKTTFSRPIFKTISNVGIHLRFSSNALLANLFTQAGYHLDLIFISSMARDSYQIGQFSFAKIVIFAMGIFISSTQQFLTPYFSKFSDDRPKLILLYKKSQLLFIGTSVFVCIFCFLFYGFFVKLLFSDKFSQSVLYYKILLLGWLARTLFSLKGPVLLGIGRVDINAKIAAITLPINSLIMYLMIKQFSILGAAVATSISTLVTYLFISFSFNKIFYRVAE